MLKIEMDVQISEKKTKKQKKKQDKCFIYFFYEIIWKL